MDGDLKKLLLEHPFFEGFDPEICEGLVPYTEMSVFEAVHYIIRVGQPANKIFLVRHGRVAIELETPGREPMVLATIDDGEVFGWSWVSPPFEWNFSARAVKLTRLLSLDANHIAAQMDADHEFGYEFYRRLMPVISERLGSTRIQLTNLYGNPGG